MNFLEIFKVCKPRYEYSVLILTLKKKTEEIKCIWNILYQHLVQNEANAFFKFFSLCMLLYWILTNCSSVYSGYGE